MLKSQFLLVALSLSCAFAWGDLGHEAVGYVAMPFLAPQALSFVQTSLGSTYNKSLGPAGPWADSVKHESGWTWSAPNHFIDAEDSPLDGVCDVSESRDCSSGFCLLTAISNYTLRIQDTSLSTTERTEALKFLDHFLGDIGQPLHVEAYEVGGNDIDTVCNGDSTNLHATWDTGMIETNLDALYDGSSKTWANTLVTRIQSGEYADEASGWISCSSITATQSSKRSVLSDKVSSSQTTSKFPELECPLVWAEESNTFDCSVVFNYTDGADLCKGSYFENAIPVKDLQIAKQGYRLAAWLNVIFDGSTNL